MATASSPYGEASRAPLRVAMALVGLHDVVMLSFLIARQPPAEGASTLLRGALGLVQTLPFLVVCGAMTTLSLVQFARRKRPLLWGLIALGLSVALQLAYNLLARDPMEMFYTQGAVLFGWCAGIWHAQARYGPAKKPEEMIREDALGEAGAAGVIGVVYTLAGTSKLRVSGFDWLDEATLRSYVLSLGRFDPESLRGKLHALVTGHPSVALAIVATTMLFQLTAFAYAKSARTRLVWGTFFLGFHIAIFALTRISYLENIVLLLAFSYPWPRLLRLKEGAAPQQASANEPSPKAKGAVAKLLLISASLVFAGWLLPLSWPMNDAKSNTHEEQPSEGASLDLGGLITPGDVVGEGLTIAEAYGAPGGFCFRVDKASGGSAVFFLAAPSSGTPHFPCKSTGGGYLPLVTVGKARFLFQTNMPEEEARAIAIDLAQLTETRGVMKRLGSAKASSRFVPSD